MKQTLKLSWVLFGLLAIMFVTSCKKDNNNNVNEVTAGFTYTIDATNPMIVHFTSTSTNQTSLSWDFGDNSAVSTEANPTHTYAAAGTYQVKLTATNSGGSDNVTQPVTIVNSNEMQAILAGTDATGKTWKLIRDVSTGRYPLQVGPDNGTGTIWWAFGKDQPLAARPCMLNDEWTFKPDGKLVFDDKGDYWAEGNVYPANANDTCTSSNTMVNVDGVDVSAWSSGTHDWAISEGKLTLTGLGAYIGLSKVATNSEVKVPQESVTYNIVKLSEGSTDTLVVETKYMTTDAIPQAAYWRFVLVHYDNPADEPPMPTGTPPVAGFTFTVSDKTVTFTNTSTDAVSYAWNFGDGTGTSTDANPTYTYTTDSIYEVTLTATNPAGPSEVKAMVLVPSMTLTDAILQAGAWKIRVAEKSVFVGPGLGMSNWWSVPLNFLTTGGANETEDWRCMTDDEFIFSAGGVYEYKTNGSARNDGYMGSPNGCWSDAQIAASGNGAAFGSHIHSYALTSNGHQRIVLTNGASGAAFIGFYKGYYGGENTDNTVAPNNGNPTNTYEVMGYGTINGKEYLYLSVDLNGDAAGGNAWSVILQR